MDASAVSTTKRLRGGARAALEGELDPLNQAGLARSHRGRPDGLSHINRALGDLDEAARKSRGVTGFAEGVGVAKKLGLLAQSASGNTMEGLEREKARKHAGEGRPQSIQSAQVCKFVGEQSFLARGVELVGRKARHADLGRTECDRRRDVWRCAEVDRPSRAPAATHAREHLDQRARRDSPAMGKGLAEASALEEESDQTDEGPGTPRDDDGDRPRESQHRRHRGSSGAHGPRRHARRGRRSGTVGGGPMDSALSDRHVQGEPGVRAGQAVLHGQEPEDGLTGGGAERERTAAQGCLGNRGQERADQSASPDKFAQARRPKSTRDEPSRPQEQRAVDGVGREPGEKAKAGAACGFEELDHASFSLPSSRFLARSRSPAATSPRSTK